MLLTRQAVERATPQAGFPLAAGRFALIAVDVGPLMAT